MTEPPAIRGTILAVVSLLAGWIEHTKPRLLIYCDCHEITPETGGRRPPETFLHDGILSFVASSSMGITAIVSNRSV
jgi:hypothetical protein